MSHPRDIHLVLERLGHPTDREFVYEVSKRVPAEASPLEYFVKAAVAQIENEKKIIRLPKK